MVIEVGLELGLKKLAALLHVGHLINSEIDNNYICLQLRQASTRNHIGEVFTSAKSCRYVSNVRHKKTSTDNSLTAEPQLILLYSLLYIYDFHHSIILFVYYFEYY